MKGYKHKLWNGEDKILAEWIIQNAQKGWEQMKSIFISSFLFHQLNYLNGLLGSFGVAGFIQNTPGAIGYVNQSYIKGNVKAAAIQNLSDEFVTPQY